MSVGKLPIVRHYLRAKWACRRLRDGRLAAYQERRSQVMVQYAVANSDFYREHWRNCDLNDWRNLRVVDKALMMANFNTFNTVGLGRKEALEVALRAEQNRDFAPTVKGYTVGLSSGTSGNRGLFVVSATEQAAWAGTLLARVLPRLRWQGWRVALFLRSNSNLYEQVGSRLLTFRYFDLLLPPEEALRQLAAYQPDILVAPPSYLANLLNLNRQHACKPDAATWRISPTKIISVAEVSGREEREQLSQGFAAPIGEIYQATEGLIGITCSQGALHIQEDVVAVQLVPPDAAQPQYVTPIITDLWRTTQPILRYVLGDIWIMDDTPCTCGSAFRVIKQVLGRVEDILYFPSLEGSIRRPVFPDQVRALISQNPPAVCEGSAVPDMGELFGIASMFPIRDYRAVQERFGHLRLHLDVSSECFATTSAYLRASISLQFKAMGCRCAELEIVHGFTVEAANVKRQRVRNMSQN